MENDQIPKFSVGEFVDVMNQTLEYAYPSVVLEGEISSFKVNQNKFVFFELKDDTASIGCFMMVFSLRVALEDGMKVVVRARPKLTKWGKFSLTVDAVIPSGEGSIRKSFELLKKKLATEGLFDVTRKRDLPTMPNTVAVLASTESAGYADFMKIAAARWGGVKYRVYHSTVQGVDAPKSLIEGVRYFNEQPRLADVLVVIRGGGSADDLAAFNDEALVRELSASRIPVVTGIGHEIDETLVDYVADVRASTPSNAAELVVPDRKQIVLSNAVYLEHASAAIKRAIEQKREYLIQKSEEMLDVIYDTIERDRYRIDVGLRILEGYSPYKVLERGYAIVRGDMVVGEMIEVETAQNVIQAKVVKNDKK